MNFKEMKKAVADAVTSDETYVYVMRGDRGCFSHIIKPDPHGPISVPNGRIPYSFLRLNACLKLYINKTEDKLKINHIVFRQHDVNNKLRTLGLEDPQLLWRRAYLFSSLAILGNSPGAKLEVYEGRQMAANRVLTVKHSDARHWLDTRMTFTKDVHKDTETALQTFWFNSDANVSLQDDLIKRLSFTHYESFSRNK